MKIIKPTTMHYTSKIEEEIVSMLPHENSYVLGLHDKKSLRVYVKETFGEYTWKLISHNCITICEGCADTKDGKFSFYKHQVHPDINKFVTDELWESELSHYIEPLLEEMIEAIELG